MKRKIYGSAVLSTTAFATFAFKVPPLKSTAIQTFYLQPVGYAYNPVDYSTTPIICPIGNANICSVEAIAASEIYTTAESIAKVGNTTYQGKPKVDIASQQIKQDIDAALLNPASGQTFPNGCVITERP